MARDFDGSTQFLSGATSAVSTFPFTFAVRYNTDTTAANQNLFGLYAGATAQAHYMSLSDSGGTKRGFASSVSTAGGFDHAITTTTVTVSTWGSMVGLYASSTSRRSVLNGDIAGAGTNTATNAPAGLDTFHAAQYNPTDVDEFDGRLAEIAVWSSIITDAEITAYDRGYSPLLISPGTLQHYWQLLGRNDPEPDLIGRGSFTLNGTPANAVHPRVYMPRKKKFYFARSPVTFPVSVNASSISTAHTVRRGSLPRGAPTTAKASIQRQGKLIQRATDTSKASVQRLGQLRRTAPSTAKAFVQRRGNLIQRAVSTAKARVQKQGNLFPRAATTAKATVLRSLVKFVTIAVTSTSRAVIQRMGQLNKTAMTTATASLLTGSVRTIFISVASVSTATIQNLANIFRFPFFGSAGLFVSRKARRPWKKRGPPKQRR